MPKRSEREEWMDDAIVEIDKTKLPVNDRILYAEKINEIIKEKKNLLELNKFMDNMEVDETTGLIKKFTGAEIKEPHKRPKKRHSSFGRGNRKGRKSKKNRRCRKSGKRRKNRSKN